MIKQDHKTPVSHGIRQMPWLTAIISIAFILLYFICGAAFEPFLYNISAIKSGETWRLISGHFIHCDNEHLMWNALAFVIIGSVIEFYSRPLMIISLVAGIIGVDIWLLNSPHATEIYCGLSGALNSMFIVAAFILITETRSVAIMISAAAGILKIFLEIKYGALITNISWQSVPLAHLSGLIAGILVCLAYWIMKTDFEKAQLSYSR